MASFRTHPSILARGTPYLSLNKRMRIASTQKDRTPEVSEYRLPIFGGWVAKVFVPPYTPGGNHASPSFTSPGGGVWSKFPGHAPEGLWRPLEAPGGPWRPLERQARLPLCIPSKEARIRSFEVGIEGVALNPNRK